MRCIAITGVSGYIGTSLLAQLESAPSVDRIIGIDLHPPSVPSPKLRFYAHDIVGPFDSIFADEGVDAAVHLAFVVRPRQDRPKAERINIQGTQNFLDASLHAGVRQAIYLSSHTVYGAHADNPAPITEDSPLRPHRDFQYSWDKARSEAMFRDFASAHPEVAVAILRSCVVLGASPDSAVAHSLFQPVMIRVAGYNPPLQFLHLYDLSSLISAFLERKQRGVFNVAGDTPITYRQLANLAGRRSLAVPAALLRPIMGLTWKLHLQAQSPPDGLSFIMHPIVMSAEKLQRAGYALQRTSKEAVTAYLASTLGPKQV